MKTALLIAAMLIGSWGSVIVFADYKIGEYGYAESSECVRKYTAAGVARSDIIVSNDVCYLKNKDGWVK